MRFFCDICNDFVSGKSQNWHYTYYHTKKETKYYKCADKNCKYSNIELEIQKFSRHIRYDHKMSIKEYAETYKNEWWVSCIICGNFFYSRGKKTCSKECSYKSQVKTKTESGCFEKVADKLKKLFKEHPEILKNSSKRGVETKRSPDGYYSTDGPKKAAQKAAKTMRENNHYSDHEKWVNVGKKANITMEKKGIKKIRIQKMVDTKNKQNIWGESARKSAKARKNNGYYETEVFKKTRKRAEEKKRNCGFYSKEKIDKRAKLSHLSFDKNNTKEKMKQDGSYDLAACLRHQTMKTNGTYGKKISNREIAFAIFIESRLFENEWNVHYQIKLGNDNLLKHIDYKKKLEIDFVIEHKQTKAVFVVYFDGTFVHGLDRPICEIAKSKTLRDMDIFNTYYSDRSFEEYCQKRNINLVRFDESTFGKFLFKNEKIVPYFVCGKSSELDLLLEKL